MPGERFSLLYAQPGDLVPDSGRARHRIGALLGEAVAICNQGSGLAAYLTRNLGVPVPGDGQYPSHWHQFVRECNTADFLDAVTIIYRYLFWHLSEGAASWWRDAARQIFNEENLGYDIDEVGGLRPKVDWEFQRNLLSAVAGFESERYKKVRELIAISSTNLCADPPNYKQAWRAILSAVEVLFGLILPYCRLSAVEIETRLRPLVERAHEGDPPAQEAAQGMLAAFKGWVEASQIYRHHPGEAHAPQPPANLAILSIGSGIAWLRWLAGFDGAHAP
jgi:hypothetical protein